MRKLTQDEFVRRANLIHKGKYNYSKSIYKNSKEKLIVTCLIHGDYQQLPHHHLQGSGCSKCGNVFRISTLTFIEIANIIHNNNYDYRKVIYKNSKTKVLIVCKIHGDFFQSPAAHLKNHGCPKCGGSHVKTTLEFISKAKLIHKNKYNYSEVTYINYKTKVKIICPNHGSYLQTPNNHLMGMGCSECKKETLIKKFSKSKCEFINEANYVHNNSYDYNFIEYKNNKTKIKIFCKIHMTFFNQSPSHHLQGQGCPKCLYKNESITEKILKKLLHKIDIKSQFKISKFRVDFYFEKDNTKYIVEYNGAQHYQSIKLFGGVKQFKKQQLRDNQLKEYCKNNNITLIEIDGRKYTGSKIKDFLQSYFIS